MAKFGFIGMGNMGQAMLKGLLADYKPSDLIFTAAHKEKMEQVSKKTGVSYAGNNAECAKQVQYLILAIKPQYFNCILDEIKGHVNASQVVISIAPGITIDTIKSKLGSEIRVVRAMPNTPALVGEGVSGISYDSSQFDQSEISDIHGFFESFGKVVVVDETLMDAVVCASGSSPAYAYMFIEALADSAVKYGLPRKAAYELAAQSLLGAAKMVLETGLHPGELKDMVCSPKGTTIAGVSALEEYGFRNAVIKATDACYGVCMNMKKNK